MPIPFLIPGAIALASTASAAVGLGAGADAAKKNKRAKSVQSEAKEILEHAQDSAQCARNRADKSLSTLGQTKLQVLEQTMTHFVHVFDQIHHVSLSDSPEMNERAGFYMDQQGMIQLRKLSNRASSIRQGLVSGAGAGALAAIGAYGVSMTFGTVSTATAFAGLSGTAAANATFALLSGGALATGWGGMALSSALMGGAVAGPAIAVFGITMKASAKKNLYRAYSNRWRAKQAAESLKMDQILCDGVSDRADLFTAVLSGLADMLRALTTRLEEIITLHGTDYSRYSTGDQELVSMAMSVASAIKRVLDTPILTDSGRLTKQSAQVQTELQAYLDSLAQNKL